MPFPRIKNWLYACFFTFIQWHLGCGSSQKNQAILLWVWVVGLPSCYGWNIPVIWNHRSQAQISPLAGQNPAPVRIVKTLAIHGISTWTPWKFNSSPVKCYRDPKGKDRLPTLIFQPMQGFVHDVITTHAGKQPLNQNPCATGSL